MTILALALVIFLEIIQYFVIFDIILSWLALAGIRFRPQFLRNILDPLYRFVRKYIPSRFGMFDFTPLIIIFACIFFANLIRINIPGVTDIILQISSR